VGLDADPLHMRRHRPAQIVHYLYGGGTLLGSGALGDRGVRLVL
jgi:hypothetical protein